MFGTCRGTLEEVRDGLDDTRGGPGRVMGPFRRSGTGPVTLPEVRDRSNDHFGGPRWVR